MLEQVHEWLAHNGFVLVGGSVLVWIGLHAVRQRRSLRDAGAPAPAMRREHERGGQSVWWGPTAALLVGIAAFAAWFGSASAGLWTEWPRQRAFASNYLERAGNVVEAPDTSADGKARVAYQSGAYAGTLAITSCALRDAYVGQPITVYVSATEPSRASLTVPRNPYTTRVFELVLVLFVLPLLAALTAYRQGLVIRRIRVPEPLASPFSSVSFAEFAKAAPAFLAVAVLVAAALANGSPPCTRGENELHVAQAIAGSRSEVGSGCYGASRIRTIAISSPRKSS